MAKVNKRENIIKAAIKIFSQNGFHKAKIEDIAKEAGIGKGTVYEYFDSKKSLFQEMIYYCIEEYIEGIKIITSDCNNTRDKLIALVIYHSKYLAKHVDIAHMAANESGIMSKEMKERLMERRVRIYMTIKEILDEGINIGELRKDLDAEIATLSLIGAMNQYCSKKIFFEKFNYKDIDAAAVVDTLLKGME
jgi:AcrR family transcriptional regulator